MKNSVFKVDLKKWAIAAGIRAIRTFGQTAASLIPAAITITQVDWKIVLGTAVCAAVLSLATSLAGIPEVKVEGE